MSSSTSMRRGFVKIKGKRPASKPKPKPPQPQVRSDDDRARDAANTSVPLFAARAPHREVPKPWWTDWRVITMIFGLVLLSAVGIYFLSQAIRPDFDHSGGKGSHSSSARQGTGFMPGKGKEGDEVWGSRSDYSAPTDESFRATYGWGKTTASPSPSSTATITGGANKVALNKNATGSCTVGSDGIQGLQDCLLREAGKAGAAASGAATGGRR